MAKVFKQQFGSLEYQGGVSNPSHLQPPPPGSSKGQREGHRANGEGADKCYVEHIGRDNECRQPQQALRHERRNGAGRQESWNEVKKLLPPVFSFALLSGSVT